MDRQSAQDTFSAKLKLANQKTNSKLVVLVLFLQCFLCFFVMSQLQLPIFAAAQLLRFSPGARSEAQRLRREHRADGAAKRAAGGTDRSQRRHRGRPGRWFQPTEVSTVGWWMLVGGCWCWCWFLKKRLQVGYIKSGCLLVVSYRSWIKSRTVGYVFNIEELPAQDTKWIPIHCPTTHWTNRTAARSWHLKGSLWDEQDPFWYVKNPAIGCLVVTRCS